MICQRYYLYSDKQLQSFINNFSSYLHYVHHIPTALQLLFYTWMNTFPRTLRKIALDILHYSYILNPYVGKLHLFFGYTVYLFS